jgi:hypothetical protein
MEKKSKTQVFIPVLVVLVFVLGGCHGQSNRYDPRLIAADSVLRMNNPDSALRLLDAIDGAKLSSAGDRAYHALLLTQAQYRCYVDITSDSMINVALDYYKQHEGEQEKLTRAYIYKGAVTEVLGDPEGAMPYYKQAVSVAAPDDHFNLGYAKMRIGSLYRDHLVADSSDINLFNEAYDYFKQIPDTLYMLTCLGEIGLSYIKNNKDSILSYLNQAIDLAQQTHAIEIEFKYKKKLAELLMFSDKVEEIERANQLTLSLYRLSGSDELLMAASFTLAKLNKPDSAVYYLSQVDSASQKDGMLVLYDKCLAEIARCHHDVDKFKLYYDRANDLSDSLVNNDMQMQLRDVESKYDNEALKYKALRYRDNWMMSLLGALLVISILTIALMMISRKSAQRKRQIADSEETIERLRNDSVQLSALLAKNHAMSEELKATIRHQIDTFTQLVELHFTQFAQFPKKFGELFSKTYSLNQPDLSFWAGIRSYADSTCDGIITRTLEEHPSLAESDVRFLSLCCCNLPTTVIMACMGYNDLHSIYNKKRRLAQELGLTGKLDDYILGARPSTESEE